MRLRTLSAVLLVAAACGDNSRSSPDAPTPTADASTDSAPGGIAVTVRARGAKLLVLREGDGAWRTLAIGADGVAHTRVAGGSYDVAVACDEAGYFDLTMTRAGATDAPDLLADCVDAEPLVKVTPPPGALSTIGPYRVFSDAAISIPPGTYDVVSVEQGATTTAPRAVIRRGVAISADTALTVDFATGFELHQVLARTTVAPDEFATFGVRLQTKGGADLQFDVPGHPGADGLVWSFPASALIAGDRQRVRAKINDASLPVERYGYRTLGGADTTADVVVPATFTSASATWAGAPSFTWQAPGTWHDLFASALTADYARYWSIHLLPGWLAEHPSTTEAVMPVPSTLPGWQSTWDQPSSAGLTWQLTLTDPGTDGASRVLYWTQAFDAATPAQATTSPSGAAHLAQLRARRAR
jgi:hypothetical protein